MDISNRYANLVDTKTRLALVLKDGVIFNNRYEGSAKAGAVKVRKSGEASVVDYNTETGAALSKDDSQYITINIDKNKAINELIDGYEAAAITDDMVADRLNEAGYAMAKTLDKDGAITLVSGGTTLEDTDKLTKSTVYDSLVDARAMLTKAGVPDDGRRYVVVSPDTISVILKSDDFIKGSDLGDEIIKTGAVGKIAGLNVYESANLGNGVEYVAGHPDYATRVNEWVINAHVQDLSGSGNFIGASAVQGRKVYGHKVTNAACILVKKTAA